MNFILKFTESFYSQRLIENKYFETVVLALILVSSGVMTLEDITYETKPMLMDTLFYLDKILTVVFLIETVIKLFSMGFVAYFSNAWCWLDFVIVGVSLVNFSAGLLGFANISIFKVKVSSFFCCILSYIKLLLKKSFLMNFEYLSTQDNEDTQSVTSVKSYGEDGGDEGCSKCSCRGFTGYLQRSCCLCYLLVDICHYWYQYV